MSTVPATTESHLTSLQHSEAIIKHYSLISAGVGFVPLPLLNWAGIITAQALMVAEIGRAFGVAPTTKERIRTLIVALVASIFQKEIGIRLAGGLLLVPVIGSVAAIFATPAMAWAATQGVGKVFETHFASGGTFLDFDPVKVQAKMKADVEAARANAPA